MATQDSTKKCWNPFAYELVDILAAHGTSLEELLQQSTIFSGKIQRLALSLSTPRTFPTLSKSEIEQLAQIYNLTEVEQQRLQAGLLATAIAKLLVDHLGPADALLATSVMFPVLEQALQHAQRLAGSLADPLRGDLYFTEDDEGDLVLAEAWRAMDSGALALHLSYHSNRHAERLDNAQQASSNFEMALALLKEVENDIDAAPDWDDWYAEARQGLEDAQTRLADLSR